MIGTAQAAKKLKVSAARIRVLCAAGRIPSAELIGGAWILPDNPIVKAANRKRPSIIKMKS